MSISSKATGLRPGVCTSTTRPSAPYTGMVIFETDTGYLRVWNGSSWDYLHGSQTTVPGVYQTYTPTWTNITVGNGTVTARYSQIGKTVFADVSLTLGSTSSVSGSGACTISLPVTAYATVGNPIIGTAQYYDSGALRYFGFVLYASTTTFAAGYDYGNRYQEIYSIGPFTWGSSDQMVFHLQYEAA